MDGELCMIHMNLYNVMDKNYEWGCFVFAPSRNRAKVLVAEHFNEDYIHLRCKTLKKGINMDQCLIVDCPEDTGYDLVLKLGFHYPTQEEIDSYYDKWSV